jgi:hypothetical protein
MAEPLVIDQAAHENSACAVRFRELNLRDGTCNIDERHDGDPAKSPLAFSANIDQPLIVTSANRRFDFALLVNGRRNNDG